MECNNHFSRKKYGPTDLLLVVVVEGMLVLGLCISLSSVSHTISEQDNKLWYVHFQVANMIRFLVDSYNKPVPAILEIPSKDHPYDPTHDSVLSRVKYLFSAESVASGRR